MSLGRCKIAVVLGFAAVLALGSSVLAPAQIPGRKVVPPTPKVVLPGSRPGQPVGPKVVAPQPKPPVKKGPKLPEPEDVSFDTKDGMTIKATYYGSTNKKETVPVILVHGFEGQRGDFHQFALFLQAKGHAAIAPDLRGHGQSKIRNGMPINVNPDRMNRGDLESMALDIAACKKFLMDKHNQGELNIELLTVIGAEFGATIAVRWAAMDWAAPDLPAYKLGKDVKALVLLSPQPPFKAVSMREALAFPPIQKMVSMMLVAGEQDSKSNSEAKKIHNALEPHHPKLPEDPEERKKIQSLYFVQPDVKLSGTKLLSPSVTSGSLAIRDMIAIFIERRLVDRKSEFMWQDRQNPLD